MKSLSIAIIAILLSVTLSTAGSHNNWHVTYVCIPNAPIDAPQEFLVQFEENTSGWNDNFKVKEEIVGTTQYDQMYTLFMVAAKNKKGLYFSYDNNKNITFVSLYSWQ